MLMPRDRICRPTGTTVRRQEPALLRLRPRVCNRASAAAGYRLVARRRAAWRVHARASPLSRRNEADLVQSVIEPGRRVRRYHAEIHDHGRDQRQGQITMRDRTAERTFTFGALDVDMDPLAIAGAGRERVDAILVDRDPFGRAELMAGELRRGRHGILGHARTYDSPRRSFRRILPTFDLGSESRKRISFGTL